MQDNLLLFDIGNTTMKVGVSVGGVRRQYTLPTDAGQTADSLGLNLLLLLREAGVALPRNGGFGRVDLLLLAAGGGEENRDSRDDIQKLIHIFPFVCAKIHISAERAKVE